MNKKILILTSITLVAIISISMIGISYAQWRTHSCKPKIMLNFSLEYSLGAFSSIKELPGNWRSSSRPISGDVTLTIIQWPPNEEGSGWTSMVLSHMYLGTLEGETNAKFDANTGEGTYRSKHTYSFDIDGEVSTFVIYIKYEGVGFNYAGKWTGFGTGIFAGIKASGVATADGTPPPPSEAVVNGIVKIGYANLPPSNFPPTP